MANEKKQEAEALEAPRKKRATDGGTYLFIADGSEEMRASFQYCIQLARQNNGHVAIAHFIDNAGFATWGGVEHMIRQEAREKAEKMIWGVAKKIHEETKMFASFYIVEGNAQNELMEIINEPQNDIRELILANDPKGAGSGSLVAYFTTKVATKMHIPLVIVPSNWGIKTEPAIKTEEQEN